MGNLLQKLSPGSLKMGNEYAPKCRRAMKGYGHVQLISSVMRCHISIGKLADLPPLRHADCSGSVSVSCDCEPCG